MKVGGGGAGAKSKSLLAAYYWITASDRDFISGTKSTREAIAAESRPFGHRRAHCVTELLCISPTIASSLIADR
jgi:hypothetical protein